MLEAQHFTAAADRKGSYALPDEFDGTVNAAVLYQAVRTYLNNQRQGTASTKTRGEVSGGNRKPWRQKGTGRARQGTIRSPLWPGGGVVFGPRPRSYRTDVPRKVRQAARRSAFNARAREGALYVVEELSYEEPKTRRLVEFLGKLGVAGKKVLVLTAESKPAVYRSGRNLPRTHVMRYADAAAYHVLWADVLVVEETAIGGHVIEGRTAAKSTRRTKRAQSATAAAAKTAKKKTTSKTTKGKTVKKKTASKRKGGGHA